MQHTKCFSSLVLHIGSASLGFLFTSVHRHVHGEMDTDHSVNTGPEVKRGKGNEFIMFVFIYFHGELCLQTNLLFKTPTFVWWHIITTFTVTLSERDPIFTWCHGCFLLFGMIYASLGSQMAKWSAFTRLGGRTFPGTELYLPEPCLAGLPMPSSWEIAVSIC